MEKIGIGIDLGGTKVAGALFDRTGIISKKRIRYLEERKGDEVGELVLAQVDDLRQEAAILSKEIGTVGIGVPGIYHQNSGTVWAPNIEAWENYPLRDRLVQKLNTTEIKIIIDSDRSCYVLGESWLGSAKGSSDVIFVAVGTGIGAGIISGGQVIRGSHGIAGAIGWLALRQPYLPEYEQYGCFEFHASGAGMARLAAQLLTESEGKLSGVEGKNPTEITAKHIFQAYQQGDSLAKSIIQASITSWGKACANLVSIFNPEIVVFGGGIFGPATEFIPDIYQEAKRWGQPISMSRVKFTPSSFGEDAGLYGAGYLSIDRSYL